MKQKELAGALKSVVILCLVLGVFLCGVLVPAFGCDMAAEYPELAWAYWPSLGALWLTCVPVLVVLVCVWRIATDIGRDNSFCPQNTRRLRLICRMALLDTGAYLLGAIVLFCLFCGLPVFVLLPFLFIMAVGIAVAVVSAALSHLVQKASDLKADQDLTI